MLFRTLASILALFASLVLLVAGNGMLGTVAALRLEIEGFPARIAGPVLACFSLGFVLGSLLAIRIVQRVGHIRAFAVFGAVATATALVHALHVSVPAWMALRFVLGFCVAGLMLVAESWANARATAQNRGALLAVYMVLFYLAASSGQFLIVLGDPATHHLFIIAAILIALSLVPLSLTRSPVPELGTAGRLGIRSLWRVSQVGVAGALLSGVAISAFASIGPIYAVRMGLGVRNVATFMGVAILAAMALQWPVGYLSDFVLRRRVILGVTTGAVIAGILTAVLGYWSTTWLYGTVAVFYGLTACIYPLCLALTNDALQENEIVPAAASLLLAYGIGTIAGPVLGGASLTYFGPGGLFLFSALALTMLLPLGLRPLARKQAAPLAEQTHAVAVAPVTTPVIMELDPRNEDFTEVSAEEPPPDSGGATDASPPASPDPPAESPKAAER
jgi:MFS family permease